VVDYRNRVLEKHPEAVESDQHLKSDDELSSSRKSKDDSDLEETPLSQQNSDEETKKKS